MLGMQTVSFFSNRGGCEAAPIKGETGLGCGGCDDDKNDDWDEDGWLVGWLDRIG